MCLRKDNLEGICTADTENDWVHLLKKKKNSHLEKAQASEQTYG